MSDPLFEEAFRAYEETLDESGRFDVRVYDRGGGSQPFSKVSAAFEAYDEPQSELKTVIGCAAMMLEIFARLNNRKAPLRARALSDAVATPMEWSGFRETLGDDAITFRTLHKRLFGASEEAPAFEKLPEDIDPYPRGFGVAGRPRGPIFNSEHSYSSLSSGTVNAVSIIEDRDENGSKSLDLVTAFTNPLAHLAFDAFSNSLFGRIFEAWPFARERNWKVTQNGSDELVHGRARLGSRDGFDAHFLGLFCLRSFHEEGSSGSSPRRAYVKFSLREWQTS